MQGSDTPYPELHSMPGPSSDLNTMHQPAILALQLSQPFTMQFGVRRRLQYVVCVNIDSPGVHRIDQ